MSEISLQFHHDDSFKTLERKDRQTHRHTDTQTDRQTDRQTYLAVELTPPLAGSTEKTFTKLLQVQL